MIESEQRQEDVEVSDQVNALAQEIDQLFDAFEDELDTWDNRLGRYIDRLNGSLRVLLPPDLENAGIKEIVDLYQMEKQDGVAVDPNLLPSYSRKIFTDINGTRNLIVDLLKLLLAFGEMVREQTDSIDRSEGVFALTSYAVLEQKISDFRCVVSELEDERQNELMPLIRNDRKLAKELHNGFRDIHRNLLKIMQFLFVLKQTSVAFSRFESQMTDYPLHRTTLIDCLEWFDPLNTDEFRYEAFERLLRDLHYCNEDLLRRCAQRVPGVTNGGIFWAVETVNMDDSDAELDSEEEDDSDLDQMMNPFQTPPHP